MSATYSSRIDGLLTSLALKVPARVATTANITLSGLQTIDGVALAEGDRVLVKDQTDAIENGIWDAAASAWTRALDFNGERDIVEGTSVYVTSGTTGGGGVYRVSSSAPVIGVSNIEFTAAIVDGYVHASRTEFENSDIATAADTAFFMANGHILEVIRGGDYTCCTSDSGTVNWSPPVGDAYVDHWGQNTTPGTTAMEAAIVSAWESGIERIKTIPGSTYLISTQANATLSNDIEFVNNAKIKGSNFDDGSTDWALQHMMRIDAGGGRYRVAVSGKGEIDGTLRENSASVASGSGLLIRDSDVVDVSGQWFNAGEDSSDAFGDSGLVPEYCNYVKIHGNTFSGWSDHPIYATNNSLASGQESVEIIIAGNHFRNTGGVRIGRGIKGITISDNQFSNVRKMVVMAGGDTNANTGEAITITGNIARGVETFGVDLRYMKPRSGAVVSGNQIYDWGQTNSQPAINLRGMSNVQCFGNILTPGEETATATSCSIGIYITSSYGESDQAVGESNETFYDAWDNAVHSNTIEVQEGGNGGVNNYGILDLQAGKNKIYLNNSLNDAPFDVRITNSGVDETTEQPWHWRYGPLGVGLGGVIPKRAIDVSDGLAVSRGADPLDTYLALERDAANGVLASYSDPASADALNIDVTTNEAHDAVTGGELALNLRIRNIVRAQITADALKLALNGQGDVQIGPDTTGGAWNTPHLVLGTSHIWRTGDDILRIKDGAPTSETDGTLLYDRRSILGNVGESGGTPTGAIIETGSDAGGRYVKYADGTMMAWSTDQTTTNISTASGSIFRSNIKTWTFPATFISAPNVSVCQVSLVNAWGKAETVTTTTATGRLFSSVTEATGQTFRLNAMGRWF